MIWISVLISVLVYVSLGLLGSWAKSRVRRNKHDCLIRYGNKHPNFTFDAVFALYKSSFSLLDIKKVKALNRLNQPWTLRFDVHGFSNLKISNQIVTLSLQRYDKFVTIHVLKHNIQIEYYVIDNKHVDVFLDKISRDANYLLPNSDQFASLTIGRMGDEIDCRDANTRYCTFQIPEHDSYTYDGVHLVFVKDAEVTKVAMTGLSQVDELIVYAAEHDNWVKERFHNKC